MKHECSRQIFEKHPYIKFRENPFSGSRVLCFRTVRQTDVTKLIVVFRNFVDAHKKDFRGRGCAEVDTIGLV